MIILKSDELVAVLLGYGDLTKWYRTPDALQIPKRLTGSSGIFEIDWLSSPIQSNSVDT